MASTSIRKGWLLKCCLALALTLAPRFVMPLFISEFLQNAMIDCWFALRGPRQAPKEIVIVSINAETYSGLHVPINQVLPRRYYAELLRKLKKDGARRVAFDIGFQEEGPNKLEDEDLAKALALIPTVIAKDKIPISGPDILQYANVDPLEMFTRSASAVARVSSVVDSGVRRRFGSFAESPDLPRLTLSEAAAGLPPDRSVKPAARDIINFYGPAGTIRTVSFYQALSGEHLPRDLFRDKIVFVGAGTVVKRMGSAADHFIVPFYSAPMSGSEIHATKTGNLIKGDWIESLDSGTSVPVTTLICFGLSFLFLSINGWRLNVLVFSMVTLAAFSGAYEAFRHQYFIPLLAPYLCAVVLPAAFGIVRNTIVVKGLFALFVPAREVERMTTNPLYARRHCEKTKLAVLFSDIQGYSTWTESLDDTEDESGNEQSWGLNPYLEEIHAVLAKWRGQAVGTIGDATFNAWGKEFGSAESCDDALMCVLELRSSLRALASQNKIPLLETRFGIHYGTVYLGFFGSASNLKYDGNGDTVDVAQRLEDLNKSFGTTLLLSDAACGQLSTPADTFFMGKVVAAGKSKPVSVFTIFDNEPPSAAAREQWLSAFELFRKRSFQAARMHYKDIARAEPTLRVAAQLFVKASRYYTSKPLPANWDGELRFKKKAALCWPVDT